MNGWGNSYDIEPSKETAPIHVNYAMRCEYPAEVAPNCLCPEKDPPEGGAQICSKRMPFCKKHRMWWCVDKVHREWGIYNYSSPEYCWKLNIIIDRPFGSVCSEHAHCAVGLQCSHGHCSTCPNLECPDRTPSDGLLGWGKTVKYGEYECPNNDCARRGEGCSPTNLGLGCCTGLKCSSGGKCITDKCKVDGDCTEDDDDICQGYFCLKNKVVNGEERDCSVVDGTNPDFSISGTFCDPTYNICTRSYDKPKVIYDYGVGHECVKHYDCHEGLYCAHNAPLQPRTCEICLVDGDCPEKKSLRKNLPCKYGDYGCPDRCGVDGDVCDDASIPCCRGLKCDGGKCVLDECKKTGDCRDDSECCDGYGCLNGKVVYAVGQE